MEQHHIFENWAVDYRLKLTAFLLNMAALQAHYQTAIQILDRQATGLQNACQFRAVIDMLINTCV